MRIAILAPPWFPVPPSGYGGIEWVVSILADALADAGHEVTLFASGDSRTRAKLSYVYADAPRKLIGRSQPELRHALACYARADEFDVINDHTGMLGAVLGATVDTPVVHTVHGPLEGEPGEVYELIDKVAPEVGDCARSAPWCTVNKVDSANAGGGSAFGSTPKVPRGFPVCESKTVPFEAP